jgi:TetR/AcrR family transcriptional regulator
LVNITKTDTREDKILAAAKKVFLAKGLAGARMQDIADEAGINKALLHYYFRSKDKLFEHIFMEIASAFLPKVIGILESDKTLFEKIEIFCTEYISQVMQTPYVPIFILNEINRQPEAFLKKMFGDRKPPFDIFLKQFQKETREGKIKPINPIQLFVNIMGLCAFPFVARPIIQLMLGKDKVQFDALMEERKTEIPKMIIASIKK